MRTATFFMPIFYDTMNQTKELLMSIKFDTSVQELKFKVLKEMAKGLFNDTLLEEYNEIPVRISPGPKSTMRCCIYKERAIVLERMKLVLGGNKKIDNIVEVIKVACDECPLGGYEVTNRCRACLAHRCQKACHKEAISFDEVNRRAHINKDKCINCGMCAKACQYNAIQNFLRPCEQACKVKAISMDPTDHSASINDEKCVQCGACVSQCPFGAIMDKSYMKEAIELLKNNDKHPVIAIIAPAIAAQIKDVKLGQIVSAIKKIGFTEVVEAALGADMVAYSEAQELAEKGFLTSSCCPAFVTFIEKNFPTLKDKISHNLSPMATIAKYIKEHNPDAKIIFVGPCVAKKKEALSDRVHPYVELSLTFEELFAMIEAKDINIASLELSELDNASYFGRVFARSGGLTEAVTESLKEQNSDFSLKPIACAGLEECRLALLKAKAGTQEFNFVEGMACIGGCVGGPCSLSHEIRDKMDVDKHAKSTTKPTIEESIKKYK